MLVQLDADSVVLRAVRWTFETGPRSGRSATAPTAETKDKVDPLIRDDRRFTSEQCAAI